VLKYQFCFLHLTISPGFLPRNWLAYKPQFSPDSARHVGDYYSQGFNHP
jgi:hypothetical protein